MKTPVLAALALFAAACAAPPPAPERPVAARMDLPPLPWPDNAVPLPEYAPPEEPRADAAGPVEELLPPIPAPGAAADPAAEQPAAEPLPPAPEPAVPSDRVVIVFTPIEEAPDTPAPAAEEDPFAPAMYEVPPAEEEPGEWYEEDGGAELVEVVEVVYDEEPPAVLACDDTPVLVVDGYNSWACGRFPVVVGTSRHDPCAIPVGVACVTDQAYDPCWDPRYDPRWGSWEAYWVDRRMLKDGRRGDPRRELPERVEEAGRGHSADPSPRGRGREDPPAADPEPPATLPERRRSPDPSPFVRDIPGRSPGSPFDRGEADGLRDRDDAAPWRARPVREDPTPFGPEAARGGNPAPWTRERPGVPETTAIPAAQDEDEGPAPRARTRERDGGRDRPQPRQGRDRDDGGGSREEDAAATRHAGRPADREDRPAFRGRRDRDDEPAPAAAPAAEEREERGARGNGRGRDRDEDGPRARQESRPEYRQEARSESRRDAGDGDAGGRNRGDGGGGHGKRDPGDDRPRGRPR